jgi:hypothetical protein
MKLHWHVGSEVIVRKCSLAENAQFEVAREADSGEYESIRSGLINELKNSGLKKSRRTNSLAPTSASQHSCILAFLST